MTIKSSLAFLLVLTLGFGVVAADAEELSSRELKKLDKKAGKALEAGRTDEALELYRQILDGTSAGDEWRQDALWTVAMSQLASAPDDETGQRYLRELAEIFPRHPRQLEAAVIQASFARLEAASAEITSAQAAIEEQQKALEAERLEMEQQEKIADENEEAADDRVRALEGQLRSVRAELAAAREELEKKEEALQRLLKLRSERGSG